ncbi:hypothetical protein BJ165DRAFT_1408764 [Panaeolus papilionaceus]|nr:hypothetical protein BJ165DRAFT_1408764 [Panaeolus papilionaceus]
MTSQEFIIHHRQQIDIPDFPDWKMGDLQHQKACVHLFACGRQIAWNVYASIEADHEKHSSAAIDDKYCVDEYFHLDSVHSYTSDDLIPALQDLEFPNIQSNPMNLQAPNTNEHEACPNSGSTGMIGKHPGYEDEGQLVYWIQWFGCIDEQWITLIQSV